MQSAGAVAATIIGANVFGKMLQATLDATVLRGPQPSADLGDSQSHRPS